MLFALPAPALAAFSIAPYFPLETGNSWRYTGDVVATVSPGVVNINGSPARELLQDSGAAVYYSNDAQGLRLHAIFEGGPGPLITFRPAILLATASADIGQQRDITGTARVQFSGFSPIVLNFASRATIEPQARITVPAGPFDTIPVRFVYRLVGRGFEGEPIDSTVTETFWLAKYIGLVKDRQISDGQNVVRDLVSTNVIPPPMDQDGDGVNDSTDNCPTTANRDQLDTDGDGQGNACDSDDDGDGLTDRNEIETYGSDPLVVDTDRDGTGDGREVALGRNPVVNEPALIQLINSIVLD